MDFDWNNDIPTGTSLTDRDTFSARWTGEIEAPETADYSFVAASDDGVRLWVCGRLVVDEWEDRIVAASRSASIPLTAGQRCEVKMEYYEHGGDAVAQLQWDYAGYRTHVVPQKQLYAAP